MTPVSQLDPEPELCSPGAECQRLGPRCAHCRAVPLRIAEPFWFSVPPPPFEADHATIHRALLCVFLVAAAALAAIAWSL